MPEEHLPKPVPVKEVPLRDPSFAEAELRRLIQHYEGHGPHVSGGGSELFDCIVNNTATTNPDEFLFASINEALNFFSDEGATRCWAIIQDTGTDYVETEALDAPNLTNVYLFGQTAGPNILWEVTENYSFTRFQIANLRINYDTGNQDNTLSGTELKLRSCWVANETFTTSGAGIITVSASFLYAEETAFSSSRDCVTEINVNSFYGALLGCQLASRALDAIVRINTSNDSAVWVDATIQAHRSGGFVDLNGAGGTIFARLAANQNSRAASGGGTHEVQLRGRVVGEFGGSSSNAALRIRPQNGSDSAIHCVGTDTTIIMDGGNVSVTGRVSSFTGLNGEGHVDITVDTGGFVRLGTDGWTGVVRKQRGDRSTSAPFIWLQGASDCALQVAGSLAVGGGAEVPYDLDATSDRNIIDFAGASTWSNPGVDNGTGNLIRET